MTTVRTLHIIGSGTIGGAENFVYQLANYQHYQDPNIQVSVLFRNPTGYFVERVQESGIPFYPCPHRIGIYEFMKIFKYLKSFDILHFHGFYPILFLAALISMKSTLYYVHGSRAQTKPINKIIINLFKGVFPTWKGAKRYLNRQWFIYFLRYFVKAIHSPTNYYVQHYISEHHVPNKKISKIALGLDFAHLEDIKLLYPISLASDVKVIGCVSTFRRTKRIDRLIDSFNLMIQKHPDRKYCLLIVGDGEERSNIESQIRSLGLNDIITLTGMRNDIGPLLKLMDVFVLPSEFENCPIALLEAMYLSLPVIVFKGSAGAEEIIEESQAGKIVKDVLDLASTLDHLFNNSSEIHTISERAHKYVLQNYSIDVFHHNIKQIYFKFSRKVLI